MTGYSRSELSQFKHGAAAVGALAPSATQLYLCITPEDKARYCAKQLLEQVAARGDGGGGDRGCAFGPGDGRRTGGGQREVGVASSLPPLSLTTVLARVSVAAASSLTMVQTAASPLPRASVLPVSVPA